MSLQSLSSIVREEENISGDDGDDKDKDDEGSKLGDDNSSDEDLEDRPTAISSDSKTDTEPTGPIRMEIPDKAPSTMQPQPSLLFIHEDLIQLKDTNLSSSSLSATSGSPSGSINPPIVPHTSSFGPLRFGISTHKFPTSTAPLPSKGAPFHVLTANLFSSRHQANVSNLVILADNLLNKLKDGIKNKHMENTLNVNDYQLPIEYHDTHQLQTTTSGTTATLDLSLLDHNFKLLQNLQSLGEEGQLIAPSSEAIRDALIELDRNLSLTPEQEIVAKTHWPSQALESLSNLVVLNPLLGVDRNKMPFYKVLGIVLASVY
ncbi:unnamed protein product [Linum tenue]|uniref:Uncharacterized protein n=1 Tax=Linum tenue TaxID=586396 RepID=A0AAV0NNK0_9ROSI|nr:unnamed protein product [Linum tenue]